MNPQLTQIRSQFEKYEDYEEMTSSLGDMYAQTFNIGKETIRLYWERNRNE